MADPYIRITLVEVPSDSHTRVPLTTYKGRASGVLLNNELNLRPLIRGAVQDFVEYGEGFGNPRVSSNGRVWVVSSLSPQDQNPFNIPGWDI